MRRRPRWRAAPTWLAVATAAEAARPARQAGIEVPDARDGRADARRSCAWPSRRTPTWSPGPTRSPRRRRACTSSSTPAWAGSARRTASARCGWRRGPTSVGLMTHFATADERGDDHFGASSRRFRSFVEEVGRDELLAHAANSAATLRDPASHFDMVRCGDRDLRHGPVPARTRPPTGSSPRCRCTRTWPPCAASSRATAPATGAAGGRSEPTWVATIPIGYGDGWRRGLSNDCRRADPRPPPSAGGHGQHGQHDRRRSGDDTDVEVGRRGGADRPPGRRAHPRRGGGAPARHDQLRDHLRPLAARAPRARSGDAAPGSSAARCATSCSAGP